MATATEAQLLALGNKQYRPPTSMGRMIWNRFKRHRLAVMGLIVIVIFVLSSAFAPLITGHDPYKSSFQTRYEAPSLKFPMGTDDLGRDVLTRILYGGRISLSVGLLAIIISIIAAMRRRLSA